MAVRTLEFRGESWTVWEVVPQTSPAANHALRESLLGGWLCIESASGEKRRIAPAPAGWEQWSNTALARAVGSAKLIRPARSIAPGGSSA